MESAGRDKCMECMSCDEDEDTNAVESAVKHLKAAY